MNKIIKNGLIILAFGLLTMHASAQNEEEKKVSFVLGVGYYFPLSTYEGVIYENAQFEPLTGLGFSYFLSLDYRINNAFKLGLGFNGAWSRAEFIKDPVINGEQVMGYLEEGAYAGSHVLFNITYSEDKEGLRPFGKLGLGYFAEQAELGDVPLALTNNVETEIFTDFKYAGLGFIPELGLSYNAITFSVAYSLALDEMEGERVQEGFQSPGEMTLSGLQFNFSYRLRLF